jgi:hypothetical protein
MARTSRRPALKAMPDLLRQRSLSEGLWNGRKGWMAVGAVVWGARGVRWALHRQERVLMREVLEPGETVIVREVPTKAPKAKPAKAPKVVEVKTTRRMKKRQRKLAEAQAKVDARLARKAAKRSTPAPPVHIEVRDEPPKLSRKDRKAIKRAAREAA